LLLEAPEPPLAGSRLEESDTSPTSADREGPEDRRATTLLVEWAWPRLGGVPRGVPQTEAPALAVGTEGARLQRRIRLSIAGEEVLRGGVSDEEVDALFTDTAALLRSQERTTTSVNGWRWQSTGRSMPSHKLPREKMVRLRAGGGGNDRAALENAAAAASSSSESSSDRTMTTSADAVLIKLPRQADSSHGGRRGANNHFSAAVMDGSMRASAHSPLRAVRVFTSLVDMAASARGETWPPSPRKRTKREEELLPLSGMAASSPPVGTQVSP